MTNTSTQGSLFDEIEEISERRQDAEAGGQPRGGAAAAVWSAAAAAKARRTEVFFGLLLVAGFAGWLLLQYLEDRLDRQRINLFTAVSKVEANINAIGHRAQSAVGGRQEALADLRRLQSDTGQAIERLQSAAQESALPTALGAYADALPLADELPLMVDGWRQMQMELDRLLTNWPVIREMHAQAATVDALAPPLLAASNQLVRTLIDDAASLELIELAGRQRFLVQQIGAGMQALVAGRRDGQAAVKQLDHDVKLFDWVTRTIERIGGPGVQRGIEQASPRYAELIDSAVGALAQANHYAALHRASDAIDAAGGEINRLAENMHAALLRDERSLLLKRLPMVLFGLLLCVLWVLLRSTVSGLRRRADADRQQVAHAVRATTGLLHQTGVWSAADARAGGDLSRSTVKAVNLAAGRLRRQLRDIRRISKRMILLAESTVQLLELYVDGGRHSRRSAAVLALAAEVQGLTGMVDGMQALVSKSATCAHETAVAATGGVDAVRDTRHGLATGRGRVQAAGQCLQDLRTRAQQAAAAAEAMRTAGEQINALSINAPLQTSEGGESAAVTAEAQRLAQQAADHAAELAGNLRGDADQAKGALAEALAELAAGVDAADRAGRATDQIKRINQRLLTATKQSAVEAVRGSKAVSRVKKHAAALKTAAEKSDLRVGQTLMSLEQIKRIATVLERSIAGFMPSNKPSDRPADAPGEGTR